MEVMLAQASESVDQVPADGDRWSYEVKWDGVRALARINAGRVRLTSRAGNDITGGYPELGTGSGLAQAHPDVLLDGEIVVLRQGVPSFTALAGRMHVRDRAKVAILAAADPATFIAFDVLAVDGHDTTALPWTARRALLDSLAQGAQGWQASPSYSDRDLLVAATREQGLEGIVAKRRESRYHPGGRTGDWIKLAHKRIQSALVGGWRFETGARDRLAALLIGVPQAQGLAFIGRVGSGITGAVAAQLRAQCERESLTHSPFVNEVPAADARGTQWCRPTVVVEVRYLGRGEANRLRQPVFRGMRLDLSPADVRWET